MWFDFKCEALLPDVGHTCEERGREKTRQGPSCEGHFVSCWKWKSLSCVWLFATHGLYSPRNSPGHNTGVGSLSLLRVIFPTQDQTQVSRTSGGYQGFRVHLTCLASFSFCVQRNHPDYPSQVKCPHCILWAPLWLQPQWVETVSGHANWAPPPVPPGFQPCCLGPFPKATRGFSLWTWRGISAPGAAVNCREGGQWINIQPPTFGGTFLRFFLQVAHSVLAGGSPSCPQQWPAWKPFCSLTCPTWLSLKGAAAHKLPALKSLSQALLSEPPKYGPPGT